MSYYHVRIAKKSGKTRWAFAFDLSKKQVVEKIITPFTHWEPFMCGRSPIEPSNVDHIRISKTGESSSQILAKTKWKRLGERFIDRFGDERRDYVDEWYILKAGEDVTRDLIKGFSLPKEVSRTFVTKEKVFLVHGRDTEPVKELKEILNEYGLRPIVLHEEASKGKTVVEKLEEYADKVGYVFVVLTPDDMGCSVSRIAKYLKRHPDKKLLGSLKARPRQNVIFEFGYFAGKLGRNRVCYLKKGNPELPSDIEGIIYISFKKSVKECKHKIVKELNAAGYEIEM